MTHIPPSPRQPPSCRTCRHRRNTISGAECWHPDVAAASEDVASGSGFGELCLITRKYGPCRMEGRLWQARRPGWLARLWEAVTA